MRTARKIIFISCFMLFALCSIIIFSYILKIENSIYYNIMYGLLSSFIVTFITSICEFYSLREQFKNDMYEIYWKWYKCFYFEKKRLKGKHFDTNRLFKRINNYINKPASVLSNYYGLFKQKDKLYYMIDPLPTSVHMFKAKDMLKCMKTYNNIDLVKKNIEPYFDDVKSILCYIDKKRFQNDIKQYDNMYYLFLDD